MNFIANAKPESVPKIRLKIPKLFMLMKKPMVPWRVSDIPVK